MQFLRYLATELEKSLGDASDQAAFQTVWSAWEMRCATLWFPHELSMALIPRDHTLREWLRDYFTGIVLLAGTKSLTETTGWRQVRDVSQNLPGVPSRPRKKDSDTVKADFSNQFNDNPVMVDTPFDMRAMNVSSDTQTRVRNMTAFYALMRFGLQYLPTHAVLLEDPALVRDVYRDVAAGALDTLAPFLHPRVLGVLLYEKNPDAVDDNAVDQLSRTVAQLRPVQGLTHTQTLGAALMRRAARTYHGDNLDIALATIGLVGFADALLVPFARRGMYTPRDLLLFDVMVKEEYA